MLDILDLRLNRVFTWAEDQEATNISTRGDNNERGNRSSTNGNGSKLNTHNNREHQREPIIKKTANGPTLQR